MCFRDEKKRLSCGEGALEMVVWAKEFGFARREYSGGVEDGRMEKANRERTNASKEKTPSRSGKPGRRRVTARARQHLPSPPRKVQRRKAGGAERDEG